MKADVNKIRRLMDGKVMTGFAGATADAFALLERFEAKLKDYPSNVPRAATELAKEWRTDRVLRRLEAMLAVVDARHTLLLTGNGDVIQPTDGILGIGSGGNYAVAAARALVAHSNLSAVEIVRAARWRSPPASTSTPTPTSWWRKWRARPDPPGNRGRTGSAHRRPGRGQAGGGRGHPQPLAAAAARKATCGRRWRRRTS